MFFDSTIGERERQAVAVNKYSSTSWVITVVSALRASTMGGGEEPLVALLRHVAVAFDCEALELAQRQ